MNTHRYSDERDGGPAARGEEREAFERVLVMLRAVRDLGTHGPAAVEAAFYVRQLWAIFIRDLGTQANGLPDKVRADLISIGLRLLRCAEEFGEGEFDRVHEIIEVSELVAGGLER